VSTIREVKKTMSKRNAGFDTADITALSHLYRGELCRSTVWRASLGLLGLAAAAN
jgi:hypothetical protein